MNLAISPLNSEIMYIEIKNHFIFMVFTILLFAWKSILSDNAYELWFFFLILFGEEKNEVVSAPLPPNILKFP